jgi:hypothetical protein
VKIGGFSVKNEIRGVKILAGDGAEVYIGTNTRINGA